VSVEGQRDLEHAKPRLTQSGRQSRTIAAIGGREGCGHGRRELRAVTGEERQHRPPRSEIRWRAPFQKRCGEHDRVSRSRDPMCKRRRAPTPVSVLIGDSDFDMPAAENAGALSIGFVDEPWKAQTLGEAGPNALVGTMSQLAAAIADAG
jgi:hypothetical protein